MWTHLAIGCNFLMTISSTTTRITATLMLFEHIPVEDHQYLVPVASMVSNILGISLAWVMDDDAVVSDHFIAISPLELCCTHTRRF